MINNPFQMLNMFKNTNNPMSLVKQLAGNNPQIQGLINNLQGKNPKELEQYARNLAQSKGIDLKQFMGQYGINI
jgi:hypothetical protein